MRTLRVGMSGSDVTNWENFLVGLNPYSQIVVDGVFDEDTADETKSFQISVGLTGDGIVGKNTMAQAMAVGFDPMVDDSPDSDGPNWPPPPSTGPLSSVEREKLFGRFGFKPSGLPNNPEAITITDGWDKKNIVSVVLPGLAHLRITKSSFHKALEPQVQKLFAEWEATGLNSKILSWGGSWAPRFIRGSRTYLSNHAWGTAFDINAAQNGLGSRPALRNEKGSVRDLVEIAYENGFYWGGWFASRKDGMHFEAYKILPLSHPIRRTLRTTPDFS